MEASKEACIGESVHDHGSVDLKQAHFFAQSYGKDNVGFKLFHQS